MSPNWPENFTDICKYLSNKALQTLFDLKAETQHSANTQGAILLTHHTSAEAPRAGSLWLTRAIESAVMIDSQPLEPAANFSRSLKKRLWWSIIARDRSLCIGLRRRSQISSLHLYACEGWLTEEDFEDEMHHSIYYDYETKKRFLAAFQEQCRLAVILTDLVSLVFMPRVASHTQAPETYISCSHA